MPYYLSETEKKTVEFVIDRFQKMDSSRKNFEDTWKDGEESYLAPFYSNDQYASDIKLPVEFSHIQHAMSETMDAPPRVIFNPKNKRGLEKRDIAQATWEHAWDIADTDRQMYWFYLSVYGLGTGVWFEGYQKIKCKKWSKVKLTDEDYAMLDVPKELFTDPEKDEIEGAEPEKRGDEDEGYEEEEVVEYDDVYGEWVPCKEFYIDDAAKTFWEPTHTKDARDCIRRRFFSPEAFKQAFEKYADAATINSVVPDTENKNTEERGLSGATTSKIEVLEYYSRVLQRKILVVNRERTINGPKGEPLPYGHRRLPYAVSPCFAVPGSPWGKGLPDLLRGIRTQEDLFMNIGMDQGKNAIQPPMLKASSMELMDEEWYAGMGYILNVAGDMNDIKELPVGELSNNFFSLLDRLEQYEILGTGQDIRSLIKSEPTAFQQANKKEISLKRLKAILQLVNWEGIRQMAQLRYANMREIYKLADLEQITKIDLNGDTKIEPKKRQIRVKDRQVVTKLDPETGEDIGLKFIPADGYIDFFELDPYDLEDYDLMIDFQLNTSKELKKLRFQEAINVLPVLLQVAQVQLLNPTSLLELWADTYEVPQTIINKGIDSSASQIPLNQFGQKQVPPGAEGSIPQGPQVQMQKQPQSMGQDITDFAQQGFNVAEANPMQ